LAILDTISRLLVEATTLDELKGLRNNTEAARVYIKSAKLGLEAQNKAAEIRLRAERKEGKWLHASWQFSIIKKL